MSRHIPTEGRAHGDEIRGENRRKIVERERKIVDQYLLESCHDILLGQCETSLSEQRVDAHFAAIEESVSGHLLKIRHNHLAFRLQQAAREHGLDLPNRQRMIVLHSESAPVTPVGFSNLAITQGWLDEFWSEIEFPPNRDGVDGRKLDAGRLIFSLIVFGGAHNKRKLQLLVEAIPNGLRRLEGLTWMDIETDRGLWRWFPDPVSMLLLQRWHRMYGADQWPRGTNTDVVRLGFNFLNFLRVLPGNTSTPNVVFRQLIETSSTRDATWMEGVLHDVQRNPRATISLPADAWARLLTKRVVSATSQKAGSVENKPIADLRPLTGKCDSDAYAGVRAIQRVLRQATRKSSSGERDKTYQLLTGIVADDSWAPVVRVLASWCASMRRYGGRQGRLVTSSIQRYLSAIANPLVTILSGTGDLNELGEDEWEWVYDQLLSSASSGKRRSDRAIVAGWFHAYMVAQYGMPEVEIEGATVNGEVDANILTPAEYIRAHSILASSDASERLIKIRKIVLTLGFRCGLRRTEIQKILIKDVQGLRNRSWSRPELFTRGNKFDGQKSSSGTRRLPLWALLMEAELNQLQDWYQYRLQELNTKEDDLLFCAPQRGSQLIPQRELFTPIQEAMRLASGTDNLRFHHLRHSCVTLTGLRFFERRSGELMREEWAKDDSGNIVMPHWGRDVFAIANRSPEWAPTRKKLWFLALLAGHASPGQTLLSYTHLMDYINGVRQTERRLPLLTLRAQGNLLGLAPGSIEGFRNPKRNGLTGATTARDLANVAHKRWPAGVCITAGKNLTSFKMPDKPALSARCESEPYTAFTIYGALFQANRMIAEGQRREIAVSSVAQNQGLTSTTLESWLDIGYALMQKPVGDGRRCSAFTKDLGKTAKDIAFKRGVGGVVLPELPECPAPPTSKLAHGLVEDIFGRIRRWLREEQKSASEALHIVAGAISVNDTQINFTTEKNKKTYLEFLERAGLKHLVRIRVRSPERGVSDREIKAHWSKQLSLPKARVVIASQMSEGIRFSMGSAQIEVRPDPKLGKGGAQNTMKALKFAVFILMLSCAE